MFILELRQAARALRASPGLSLAVVATLGLGIGFATAMFGVVDTVLVRPLPFEAPDRLVALWTAVPKDGLDRFRVSSFDYAHWREEQGLFERLALTGSASATLTGGEGAVRLAGTRVSEDYFPLLGVHSRLGRLFGSEDFLPSAAPVVVLSQALWVGRFGGDPTIVGRPITLDDETRTVIGVLPRQMLPAEAQASGRVPFVLDEEHFWAPLRLAQPPGHGHVFGVLGRLRDGVTMVHARDRLAALARRLQATFPETHAGAEIVLAPLADEALGAVRSSLVMLMGAVGCLLVVACVNVTHLLLLRAASREREIAVRTSLGASRAGIARLFLAEDLLLAGAGGAVALIVAFAVLRTVIRFGPVDVPRLADSALDGRAIAASLFLCLSASLMVSLAPVLRWAGLDPAGALHVGGRGSAASATRRWRRALAASEMALAVVLVIGAGLLAKSLLRLEQADPGFDPGPVLVFEVQHPPSRYPDRISLVNFYERLLERLGALPGVTHVAASYDPPLASNWYQSFDLPDVPPSPDLPERGGLFRTVTPGYFDTLGVDLREGRVFTEGDDVGASGAAIVNEALVKRYLAGRSPLGQRFVVTTTQWRWGDAVPRAFRIVGVVKSEVFGDLGQAPEPAFYLPFRQTPQEGMSVVVRARRDAAHLLPEVRRVVGELDPSLAVARARTLDEIMSASVARPRFRALVLVAFAAVALLLALVGLSGVLGDSVLQRRQEIGVRLALGAERRSVFLLLMREGLGPAILGLLFGVLGALALGRLLGSMLYDVTPADPAVFVAVGASLLVGGVAACLLPAWRASRSDPMAALRAE
jgi:putative ABC transport system permease protein